ncbi:tyrosine-protein phosphatase [Mucilaginibacter paludis]|uniref:protein-tyrosine-phosphatase n=1 Tax=Mucilaginibacter paludis DSM 18603 TaxID=714943 RepID=H1Y4E0_9SPHI|nr:CpsB/CapC family capsule biosynthesis tyrosine phosphatase [Mucilaginibacter paludis]EHQ25774.1 capsular polysaccharide biosynthesis protein [Mucilaginibacter paludis DSM 18603]
MFNIFKKKPVVNDIAWIGVDIHSHLIPGVDDGSPDVETSVEHIVALHALGYKKFICTPHIFKEIHPNSQGTILPALKNLKDALAIKNIDVQVEAAAEYMIDPDFDILLKNEDFLCLPGKHILIEMSYLTESHNIEKYIFDLVMKGYIPILAHPERYIYYHSNFERYRRFAEMGCLLQLNLLSVAGYYGKEIKIAGMKLLKENMITFLGTDFHNKRHLETLQHFIGSGKAYELLGKYPFKNEQVFGNS